MRKVSLLLPLILLSCGKEETARVPDASDLLTNGVRSIEISESADVLVLSENTEIDGYVFLSGTTVAFTPDGNIRFGVLAEGAMVNGKWHNAGSFVEFNEYGEDE